MSLGFRCPVVKGTSLLDRRSAPPLPGVTPVRVVPRSVSAAEGVRAASSFDVPTYDVLVIGADLTALATAVTLVKDHGIRSVAVIRVGTGERAVGCDAAFGDTEAEATPFIAGAIHDSLAAWDQQGLARWATLGDLFSSAAVMENREGLALAHSYADERAGQRWVFAHRRQGAEAEWRPPAQTQALCPRLDCGDSRFPVLGAAWSHGAGVLYPRAAAWGYAAMARQLGIALAAGWDVQRFILHKEHVRGVETAQGVVSAATVVVTDSGLAQSLMAKEGIDVPLSWVPWVRLESDPIKPCLDPIVRSLSESWMVCQRRDGVVTLEGRGPNRAMAHDAQGRWALAEQISASVVALLPSLSRVQMRHATWGCDGTAPDGLPIMGDSPLPGALLSIGWGARQALTAPGVAQHLAERISGHAPENAGTGGGGAVPGGADLALSRFGRGGQG